MLAALAARKEGKTFAASDATRDLLRPELEVIVLNVPAAYDAGAATVREIIIVSRGAGAAGQVIQPTNRVAAASRHYRLYEIAPDNKDAVAATFPLATLTTGNELRVSYSHVVRGSSAITNCKDCVVPLFSTRVR